jgi:hypothetical protein
VGFLNRVLDRFSGVNDPVDGTYEIVSATIPFRSATYSNCAIDGVVSGPGIEPTAVHHEELLAPTAKWPTPGDVLPVTFQRGQPQLLMIRWDDIPSAADRGRREAEELAARQRDQASAPSVPMPGGRPAPGQPGGGLTPEETAAALGGQAAAMGLAPTTATVLASHEVAPDVGPGGTWDLTLDVAPAGGATGYTTVVRISFSSPAKRADIAATGRVLPVLADPTHPDRIAIDATRL